MDNEDDKKYEKNTLSWYYPLHFFHDNVVMGHIPFGFLDLFVRLELEGIKGSWG